MIPASPLDNLTTYWTIHLVDILNFVLSKSTVPVLKGKSRRTSRFTKVRKLLRLCSGCSSFEVDRDVISLYSIHDSQTELLLINSWKHWA